MSTAESSRVSGHICAVTCDCYPADPLVRRTAEAAVHAGFEYHVICSLKDGQPAEEVFNQVHVHRIRLRARGGKPLGRVSGLGFKAMVWFWSVFAVLAARKIAALHLHRRFDVVHVHNMPDFLIGAAIVPQLMGARVILHVQDLSPEVMSVRAGQRLRGVAVLLAKWQERASTKMADHVLTVGWPFQEVLERRGVPPQKLSSLLNSADPGVFPLEKRSAPFLGRPTPERPLVLMYHGTCNYRSGLDIAIRAFARARTAAPHLRLRFKGSGPALPHLKQLADELDVAQLVTFLPGGPIDEVVDFVAEGDIGLIPYRSDGFMDLLLPTKAYEFALMRRPMIASDTVAIRSMFRPESLVLCTPSNVDHLAGAIVDLYQNPQRRARLIDNAEADYAPYRWELMGPRYPQLLAKLVTEGGPKKPKGRWDSSNDVHATS